MSGAMRKIGEYLGLLEDTGVYDDEYDEQGYADGEPRQSTSYLRAREGPAPHPVADISQRRRTPAPRHPPAASPSCPASPPCTRAPTTRRAPSVRTSATAFR